MSEQDELRVAQVLDGLRFPAAKWQILTYADLYGADSVTTALLHELPVRTYHSCVEVAAALPRLVERSDVPEQRRTPVRAFAHPRDRRQ